VLRLLAAGGHQVEDHAHGLHLAGDDVQLAGDVAGVVSLDVQAKPLEHRRLRDPFALIAGDGRVHCRDRGAVQLGAGGEACRAQVGHPVVVSGDADVRGHNRVELRGPLYVLLGDLVDSAHKGKATEQGNHERGRTGECLLSAAIPVFARRPVPPDWQDGRARFRLAWPWGGRYGAGVK
jgi:hypothetical protein